jgi:hypothetical protein
MKNRTRLVVLSIAAAAASGCLGYERKSTITGPSGNGIGALSGNWTSGNIIPSPNACSNFKWNPTEQTATTARGAFSATCAGDLQLTGTAQGTLTGSGIEWSADGNATAPGLPSCRITLTGMAELGTDSIRIPYSGNTCLGPVSGVETLRRR